MQLENTAIIFDLDGTLVDSAPDLTAAMNHVLTAEGHEPLALEKVRSLVGHGARALLMRGFALHESLERAEADMESHIALFLDYYTAHIADETRPFAGCEAALDTLAAAGARLCVCTNKLERLTYPLLDALGLTGRFETIVCRDTLPVYKPAPEPLLACIERTGAARGVMIGDTPTDLNAAIAAGLPCVLARFGYGTFSQEESQKAGWFGEFADLPGLLSSL